MFKANLDSFQPLTTTSSLANSCMKTVLSTCFLGALNSCLVVLPLNGILMFSSSDTTTVKAQGLGRYLRKGLEFHYSAFTQSFSIM